MLNVLNSVSAQARIAGDEISPVFERQAQVKTKLFAIMEERKQDGSAFDPDAISPTWN